MTLEDFIKNYDFENSIVLLEGKRKVLEKDREKLIQLGKSLASQTTKMIFRSGNAPGADQYFSEGVAAVDNSRLQVITPYAGHRKKTNLAYDTIDVCALNIPEEPEIIMYSKKNKKTEDLIDKYVAGGRDKISIKAAYIIRDTVKVLGAKNIKPATFGIFYDDLLNPKSGGTGHTMNVCEENNIPVVNQSIWFEWIKQN